MTPGAARDQLPGTAVRWRFQKNVPYIPAPLLYQGVYYMVKTGGIVTTLDPVTGTLLKEGRATGALGQYYASPVAADGRVYVANLEGKITVLKSGGQWEILAQNDLQEEISATPASPTAGSTCAHVKRCTASSSRLSPAGTLTGGHHLTRRSVVRSASIGTQALDRREQVIAGARHLGHERRCSDFEGPLPHVRVVQSREHDDFRLRVRPRNLTARVQTVGMREVEIEHNHVRLELLHGVQDCAGVRDGSHDLAVQ